MGYPRANAQLHAILLRIVIHSGLERGVPCVALGQALFEIGRDKKLSVREPAQSAKQGDSVSSKAPQVDVVATASSGDNESNIAQFGLEL
jgi:hypothetical protein